MDGCRENSERTLRHLCEIVGSMYWGDRDGGKAGYGEYSGSGHITIFLEKFTGCKGKELNMVPGFWFKELGRWWYLI